MEGGANLLIGMLIIVCLHRFRGRMLGNTVFLHSNVVLERVLARVVGLEAYLSDRPGCYWFCVLAERE